MINLTNNTVELGDQPQPIIRWEVWFLTPFGLTERLETAVAKCKENDLSGELLIKPVAVAITDRGDYEAVLK